MYCIIACFLGVDQSLPFYLPSEEILQLVGVCEAGCTAGYAYLYVYENLLLNLNVNKRSLRKRPSFIIASLSAILATLVKSPPSGGV